VPVYPFLISYIDFMRFIIFSLFLSFAAVLSFAQQQQEQDTTSANQAVLADVTIFSQMPLGSIYILWSNFDAISDEVKRQITSRNFVLEPYFMQNIDREQFEQNQILHLFNEQKKAFFKLFPDEEED
jgi:parvulin-like peptidyl-prolyl isomerase